MHTLEVDIYMYNKIMSHSKILYVGLLPGIIILLFKVKYKMYSGMYIIIIMHTTLGSVLG